MVGHDAGSDVALRIAALMVSGMVAAPILALFVIPQRGSYFNAAALARRAMRSSPTQYLLA
jgi:Cu/Ag efflux pump CusA